MKILETDMQITATYVVENNHGDVWAQKYALDIVAYDFVNNISHGLAVRTPVAGKVVEVVNDQPNKPPGVAGIVLPENWQLPDILGNYAIIQNGDVFTFICHMEGGTVTVNVSDLVAVGDVVGKCGNSGRTSEPHVHIHSQYMDKDDLSKCTPAKLPFIDGIRI